MSQIANITVKKNDGTTDIVYTAVVPSAGDKTPAIWRSNTVGSAAAHRPELRVSSQSNGPKTARRVEVTFVYPTTVTGSDGKVTVSDRQVFTGAWVIPTGMPDADVNEAISQGVNLLASTLLKDTLKSGYAPT